MYKWTEVTQEIEMRRKSTNKAKCKQSRWEKGIVYFHFRCIIDAAYRRGG
jgi:hypothetical protein